MSENYEKCVQNVGEPRPKTLNWEMRKTASEALAGRLLTQGIVIGDLDELSRDIASVARLYMDGYEIARMLESPPYNWGCNLEIAEALDDFHFVAESLLTEQQFRWAKEHNITPVFNSGDHVKARWGGEYINGVIVGVYEHKPAQYTIQRTDTHDNSGLAVVNFEDVCESL